MKEMIKISDLRKERKSVQGTFFQVVYRLYADADLCPLLKKVLPESKNKAQAHEEACKVFVKFGQAYTRKVRKVVDGVICVTEVTRVKNTFTYDEVMRYFLAVYNENV